MKQVYLNACVPIRFTYQDYIECFKTIFMMWKFLVVVTVIDNKVKDIKDKVFQLR